MSNNPLYEPLSKDFVKAYKEIKEIFKTKPLQACENAFKGFAIMWLNIDPNKLSKHDYMNFEWMFNNIKDQMTEMDVVQKVISHGIY